MSLLSDFASWTRAKRSERLAAATTLGRGLDVSRTLVGAAGLLEVRQRKTGLAFVVVPGATFTMGVDDDERRELLQIAPAHVSAEWSLAIASARPRQVMVRPFLCARAPLLVRDVEALGIALDDKAERPYFGDERASPVHLTIKETKVALRKLGMRLLTQAEWELVARDGGRHAFVCEGRGAPIAQAERAARALYGKSYAAKAKPPAVNDFGVWGMPLGEWVTNKQRGAIDGIRGGPATFYPWHDDAAEMLAMHAAIGTRWTGKGATAGVRVAIDLPSSVARGPEPQLVARQPARRIVAPKLSGNALRAKIQALGAKLVPPRAKPSGKPPRVDSHAVGTGIHHATLVVSYLDRKGQTKHVTTGTARGEGRDGAMRALLQLVESMVP